mgnify:CR=1 FL=1
MPRGIERSLPHQVDQGGHVGGGGAAGIQQEIAVLLADLRPAAPQSRSQADPPEPFREISCGDFSLAETVGSGQVFHWDPDPDVPGTAYTGCLGETALRLWQPCSSNTRLVKRRVSSNGSRPSSSR